MTEQDLMDMAGIPYTEDESTVDIDEYKGKWKNAVMICGGKTYYGKSRFNTPEKATIHMEVNMEDTSNNALVFECGTIRLKEDVTGHFPIPAKD